MLLNELCASVFSTVKWNEREVAILLLLSCYCMAVDRKANVSLQGKVGQGREELLLMTVGYTWNKLVYLKQNTNCVLNENGQN